jgi:putative transposase
MANTYSQLHIQVVVAVKYRRSLILPPWNTELHRYITGCVQNLGAKMLAINSMPDHLHIFMGIRPEINISTLVQKLKCNSSKWINESKFTPERFQWQEGFGVFSYRKSDCPCIVNYINRQQQHHATKNFREEYIELLNEFEVDFDERYLFNLLD